MSGTSEKMILLLVILILNLFPPFFTEQAFSEEMIKIGAVEEVILLQWNIKVPARIDTGASISSLDVKEIVMVGEKDIEFSLPQRCGNMKIRLPVIAWRIIKSSEGVRERRPVIELEICLGPKRLRTPVTLNDRSSMEFPLIIGRKTLEGNFIVDVSGSYITSPLCNEGILP